MSFQLIVLFYPTESIKQLHISCGCFLRHQGSAQIAFWRKPFCIWVCIADDVLSPAAFKNLSSPPLAAHDGFQSGFHVSAIQQACFRHEQKLNQEIKQHTKMNCVSNQVGSKEGCCICALDVSLCKVRKRGHDFLLFYFCSTNKRERGI